MTVPYFNGATLEVSVAFSKNALDTVVDGDYTDISADVRGVIQIDRGRSSETDTFTTGSLQITLDNRGRKYDPEYSAGTYFGNLVPMKHIRVRLTYSASTSYLFHGYVRSWDQGWADISNHDATCTVYADDAMKMLGLAALPECIYAIEIQADTPTAWYRLGEVNADTLCLDSSGNGNTATYTSGYSTTTTGLVELSNDGARVTDSGNSVLSKRTVAQGMKALSGTTWSLEMWAAFPTAIVSDFHLDYLWAQSTGSGWTGGAFVFPSVPKPTISVVFSQSSGVNNISLNIDDGTNTYQGNYHPGSGILDGSRHHIVITRNGSTAILYIDGAAVTWTSTSGTLTAGSTTFGSTVWFGATKNPSYTFDEVATYSSTLSAARVLAHYTAGSTAYAGDVVSARITRTLAAAGMSTFPTSLETSTQTVRGCDFGGGGVSLLTYLQTLERTEDGRLFISADGTLTFYTRYHDAARAVATAFSDVAGSTLPYAALAPHYDDSRIVNDALVSRTNGVVQRVTDSTSKTANGLRSRSIDGLANQSDSESLDRANATVYEYKNPTLRFEAITTYPRKAPATLFPVVRTTEIGARVSIRRLPVGVGSAMTKELTVEGISHNIGIGGDWTTSYLTAPGDFSSVWLILDDATYGLLDTGRLGY